MKKIIQKKNFLSVLGRKYTIKLDNNLPNQELKNQEEGKNRGNFQDIMRDYGSKGLL